MNNNTIKKIKTIHSKTKLIANTCLPCRCFSFRKEAGLIADSTDDVDCFVPRKDEVSQSETSSYLSLREKRSNPQGYLLKINYKLQKCPNKTQKQRFCVVRKIYHL
ncbi:MAG: hypothetical protein PHX25_00305 [Candidatus Pacebacteria bacterium]|nr:hypothetical protein [Candidatus Paceibacterota bacterium]